MNPTRIRSLAPGRPSAANTPGPIHVGNAQPNAPKLRPLARNRRRDRRRAPVDNRGKADEGANAKDKDEVEAVRVRAVFMRCEGV